MICLAAQNSLQETVEEGRIRVLGTHVSGAKSLVLKPSVRLDAMRNDPCAEAKERVCPTIWSALFAGVLHWYQRVLAKGFRDRSPDAFHNVVRPVVTAHRFTPRKCPSDRTGLHIADGQIRVRYANLRAETRVPCPGQVYHMRIDLELVQGRLLSRTRVSKPNSSTAERPGK